MKSYDVLSNLQNVTPYFQPIINADQLSVIGYEVLGRVNKDGNTINLGPFFHDPNIPIESKNIVDNYLQRQALEYTSNLGNYPKLFFNRNPNALLLDEGEKLYSMLLEFSDRGFPLHHIVLEITEHDYNGNISEIKKVLTKFTDIGVQIAIDDVGTGANNLDRIAILEPSILKVDINSIKEGEISPSYDGIIYSLSLLARKIGASLLFEGIEDYFQFNYAWKNGGRFYQGYKIGYPDKLPSEQFTKSKFEKKLLSFIEEQKQALFDQHYLSVTLNNRVKTLIESTANNSDFNHRLLEIANELTDLSMRLYICDSSGYQKTANIVKSSTNSWTLDPDYKNKNWSWRPYFLEGITRMTIEQKGILSDVYNDVETNQPMRTFSYPLEESYYLFIDIPLSFLNVDSSLPKIG
ncbi:EAL domain-containing protein [Bacillus sp. Marseille-P3661]|uniref:EAL domain-containing protein n=1 Tax=Bacillus sp. Marseille-P3661 TaxID=1936234 RepID=UPI000C8344EB|nr:EAL-associated domain-containing protein [Bacillus sp. Marseille-P3661]